MSTILRWCFARPHCGFNGGAEVSPENRLAGVLNPADLVFSLQYDNVFSASDTDPSHLLTRTIGHPS
jgi:hypothetical protein